jgi:hypothetical protein
MIFDQASVISCFPKKTKTLCQDKQTLAGTWSQTVTGESRDSAPKQHWPREKGIKHGQRM